MIGTTHIPHRTFSGWIVAAVICTVGGCDSSDSAADSEKPWHTLQFGRRLSELHTGSQTVLMTDGGHKGEEIVFHLNGHPLIYPWHDEISIPVNDLLQDGRNTVALADPPQADGYIQVVRLGEVVDLGETGYTALLEREVSKASENEDYVWTFEASVDYTFDFDPLPIESDEDKAEIRSQILTIVRELHKAMRDERGEYVAEQLLVGPRIWAAKVSNVPDAYGGVDAYFEGLGKQTADFVRQHGSWCQPLEESEVRFLYGPHSVFVFAGIHAASDGVNHFPYLFTFTDESGTAEFWRWPLRFCRIDDQWIIWHYNQ